MSHARRGLDELVSVAEGHVDRAVVGGQEGVGFRKAPFGDHADLQPAGQRMGVDRFAQQRIFCLIHASAPFKK